jgi:hypothetical protein
MQCSMQQLQKDEKNDASKKFYETGEDFRERATFFRFFAALDFGFGL